MSQTFYFAVILAFCTPSASAAGTLHAEHCKLGLTLTNYDFKFVRALPDFGVKSVRLFDAADLGYGVCNALGEGSYSANLLEYLSEVGINDVTINLNNWAMMHLCDATGDLTPGLACVKDPKRYSKLVAQYVKNHTDNGMKLRVAVGQEPLYVDGWPRIPWAPHTYKYCLPEAVENVVEALQEQGLSVPVTVPWNFGVLENTYPPENAEFRKDLVSTIARIAKSINESGSEFTIHPFPWSSYVAGDAPLDKAIGDVRPYQIGQKWYTGILSQQIEAFRTALQKLGYQDAKVVIGETGWPSFHPNVSAANVTNAQKYFTHLMAYAAGSAVESHVKQIYLFSDWDSSFGLFNVRAKYDVHFPNEGGSQGSILV